MCQLDVVVIVSFDDVDIARAVDFGVASFAELEVSTFQYQRHRPLEGMIVRCGFVAAVEAMQIQIKQSARSRLAFAQQVPTGQVGDSAFAAHRRMRDVVEQPF